MGTRKRNDEGTLADLVPDSRNARRHTPTNIGLIADSLQEVGAARSIVVDENHRILAGNGVVEAAAEVGIERVKFVDVDGETIVAVRRHGLSARQKERLALADNRASELSDWDVVELARKHGEDPTILDGLFPDDEKKYLLKLAAQQGEVPTLDALGEQYGDPDERALWPVVRVQVAPATYNAFRELFGRLEGEDEAARFARLLDLAGGALGEGVRG